MFFFKHKTAYEMRISDWSSDVCSSDLGRATGVVIRRGRARETLRAAGGVILSAGAFNSPQILMLSGIGPAAHLRDHGIAVVADRAGVGANLQDHIDYVSSWATRSTAPFGDSIGGTWRMVKAIVEPRPTATASCRERVCQYR